MNTATAQARKIAITPREGLEAMRVAWALVEELNISLYPPYIGGGKWLAGKKGERYEWGWGETPIAAVEDLLRRMGESW